MSEQKRPGRRPKDQKRLPLSIRITPALRDVLVSTAKANGRSITQEAEIRLEHTIRDERRIEDILDLAYGPRLAGILMAIGRAMQDAGRDSYFGQVIGKIRLTTSGVTALLEELEKWISDPDAFEQSIKAATTILNCMRPEGEYVPAIEMNSALLQETELNEIVDLADLAIEPSAIGHVAGMRVLLGITQPDKFWLEMKRLWSIIREKLGPQMVARIARRAAAPEGSRE
jgi:hypothetical protein